jgi:putative DNA primase/helicase
MFVDREELQPYLDGDFDLIPIHRWDKVIDGRERGKSPRDNRWVVKEYEQKDVLDWIEKGGNVGVRLGEDDLIIDIDPKHDDAKGESAGCLELLLELELGIDLSGAPAVETGSGGRHIYLKRDPAERPRGKLKAFGGAIEFKRRGHQVLAAGSKHPSGNHYRWLRRGDPALAPTELIAALRRPDPTAGSSSSPVAIGSAQLARCLEQLDPTEFRGYDDWRNLMFAVHDACGGSPDGRDIFIRWSVGDPQYLDAAGSIEKFWDAIQNDRAEQRTARTLFWHVLQRGGGIPPGPAADDFTVIEEDEGCFQPKWQRDARGKIRAMITHNIREAITVLGLDFKRNLFIDRIMIFEDGVGSEISDDTLAHVAMLISNTWGARWTGDPDLKKINTAIKWIVKERTMHPVREYLESLDWDGTPRLDSWLIEAAGAEPTAYTRAVSRLFLVAAVARIYSPGIKFDAMIILEGRQGVGKSMLVRALGGKWTLEGLPPLRSPNDKDVISAMLGYWLVEIEELAAMRKADADTLKAFVSKQFDRVRLPYEANARTFPRQCILVGTTNDAAYLRDITGNRRFIPVTIGEVDFSKINRDQLWAEAVLAFKSEPRDEITLPREIWGDATVEQEKRRIEDPWEELVGEFLDKMGNEPVTTETLFTEAFHRPFKDASQYDMKRLSQVMQRLGWHRAELHVNGLKRRGFRHKNIDRMFD